MRLPAPDRGSTTGGTGGGRSLNKRAAVIGGGLAGCEAAWQIVRRAPGVTVDLFEMRPTRMTPAHQTAHLAELVCSNSLKSEDPSTPAGELKEEMAALGSLVIESARACRVPAGSALAVDREQMGRMVTRMIETHPAINLVRREITAIPESYDQVIVATGPLTADALAESLRGVLTGGSLYFYDAIAPIVEADSVDRSFAFTQDRRGAPGDGAYLNLPTDEAEYRRFIAELLAARTTPLRAFEEPRYFEGCLPVEVIASRGEESLAFGPMKPVGLTDPRTGRRPYAVVQLRPETVDAAAYSMVAFQTRLAYPEQERVFRMIPGLRDAVFLRHGSLHRNTFINGPRNLDGDLSVKGRPEVRFAGQITGVEGYAESAATGMLAGLFAAGAMTGRAVTPPPPETTLGALLAYVTDPARGDDFQPSNINYSLFPPLSPPVKKRDLRRAAVIARAVEKVDVWREGL
ncbi:MAG: methylenetetrahydrofolate--tRNA-(uracil(54)-C(5))-methyltransferase (FADH(2)-oxidizing) TrmFO [Nitrospinae bacterium]|nr:methylenetetrahydrofolate--tRNA-(uracil(54)-C(5))-methyltransferase (FADH(2)-oxidizing) TrmFO [Nitrospinota bacterium]